MHSVTGAEEDVARIFNARSIAVVGASSKPYALPWWPLELLRRHDYLGCIYPVNPNRDSIDGLKCYRAIGALPGPVDLAIIALNAELTEGAVRECADAGVSAVVLPAQGFSEQGGDGIRREQELHQYARERGMRIVGANTDGLGNLATGTIASIQPLLGNEMPKGSVAIVSQSGATAGSLLTRLGQEGIGCGLYAAAGNEIDLGLEDYLSYMVQDPEVSIVLSFVETLRRPAEFVAVAELAAELDKPIALIKVGRTEKSARRAQAHTGALTGPDKLYDALFRSLGVIRVDELAELVAVAKLHLAGRQPRSKGVGVISGSGGQASVVADRAIQLGLDVPDLDPEVEAAADELLRFGKAFNPCDVTGDIATDPTLTDRTFEVFSRQPELGTILYARKRLTGNVGDRAAASFAAAASHPGAPASFVYSYDGPVDGAEAAVYVEHGVPVFTSLQEALLAVGRLADRAASLARRAERRQRTTATAAVVGAVSLNDGMGLLAAYGIPTPREALAENALAAVAAAEAFGYPVLLKVASERILHKTEAGGVELGLRDAAAVAEAYERIVANALRYLGDASSEVAVLVQEQIPSGVELIAGVEVDEQLGPFVLVGLGGVTAELLEDVAIRPAPIDAVEALEMIRGLRGAPLLEGFRGGALHDVEAAADAVSALSRVAVDRRRELAELDVNPLIVLGQGKGVRAADVLVVAS